MRSAQGEGGWLRLGASCRDSRAMGLCVELLVEPASRPAVPARRGSLLPADGRGWTRGTALLDCDATGALCVDGAAP
eukprot:8500020-Lingulodinium_polyedra.AAC.1